MRKFLVFCLFVLFSGFSAAANADLLVTTVPGASPYPQIVVPGTVNMGTFNVVDTNNDADVIRDLTVNVTSGTNEVMWCSIYNGTTTITSMCVGGQAMFYNLGLSVPPNAAGLNFSVNAELTGSGNGYSGISGDSIQLGITKPIKYIDGPSTFYSSPQSAYTNTMDYYGSRPYFTNIPISTGGGLLSGAQNLLGKFAVDADQHGDIALQGITVGILGKEYPDGLPNTFQFTDRQGIVLDTETVPAGSSSVTFHPYNSNLRLAAGTEFPFEIWGQAHDFGDIQLWLDGNNPNNLSWSIMGQTGTFHEADKIYGTGIYSQDLVNPLVTPEPSTFALLAVAAVAGIIYRRCRRRQ